MSTPTRLRAVLSYRHALLPALLVLLLLGAAAAAEEAPELPLPAALRLGPLPLPPAEPAQPLLHGEEELVPEIDPQAPFPAAGQELALVPDRGEVWARIASQDGGFVFDVPGVQWLAARLRCDRWTQVTLDVRTRSAVAVYWDGEQEKVRDKGDASPLSLERAAPRGTHTLLLRLEIIPEAVPDTLRVTAKADPAAGLSWNLEARRAPAFFADDRGLASLGPLAVSAQGKLVARRLSRRNPTGEGQRSSLDVLDARGRQVAADLGGPDARPLLFAPDGQSLLLALRGEDGTDLLLWTAPAGPVRTLLRDEPDLGAVRFSPDGRYLLLASSRGVEPEEEDTEAARHRRYLREKLTDWTPEPHLHLVEVATGARRSLTRPGDFVLDDTIFLPDGSGVIYGRTLPRPDRPWFFTEIRRLDLASGADELVASFVAGWEVRPQSFAVAPDGRTLAFLGPPEQVGDGHAEHNTYNKQVWRLDLASGEFTRLTVGLSQAFEGGGGLPAWTRTGEALLVRYQDGAESGLGRLEPRDGSRRLTTLVQAGGLGSPALSSDAAAAAFSLSEADRPPALYLLADLQGRAGEPRRLEDPDAGLLERWLLASSQDASCTGPGGERIEAWWFPPLRRLEPDGAIPVVLYYYGGSSPRSRSFNFTNQWLAANGYAVLVVNPRGAYGYGEAFADVHAGDWGPKASADILACLDAFLAAHAELDGSKVGIYGGSYGGFVTEYLVTVTDRFAAAVSMYGISDIATYWGQGTWGWTYGDMASAGALPWTDPELYLGHSPFLRADRIKTPLLLLHGLADVNVTPGESEQLFTALAVQDKPVELVLFPGEDHGIAGSFADLEAHRSMLLEWFDRWLRDQPEAWQERWKAD